MIAMFSPSSPVRTPCTLAELPCGAGAEEDGAEDGILLDGIGTLPRPGIAGSGTLRGAEYEGLLDGLLPAMRGIAGSGMLPATIERPPSPAVPAFISCTPTKGLTFRSASSVGAEMDTDSSELEVAAPFPAVCLGLI